MGSEPPTSSPFTSPVAGGNPLIGARELGLMKPSAFLVNTSRGDLIDEQALADALDAARIGGAGLDVFGSEPPQTADRLLRSDRAILSPHSAALTRECAMRMSESAAQNILDFFEGTPGSPADSGDAGRLTGRLRDERVTPPERRRRSQGGLQVQGKKRLGIGLIGSGFMGKTHALGFAVASRVFDIPFDIDLAVLADVDAPTAARAAASLGFRRSTGNWRDLLADPEVQVVDITTPNTLHREMALAAIAAGKHVYCEKPLAPTAAEALEMTRAAAKAGVATQVGFNYLKNPMLALAKRLIESGEIGEVRTFRGVHAEDYMADARSPWTWRLDPAGGGGALADIGSHILATARYLVGPISELIAEVATPVGARPSSAGAVETRPVEVDDVARLMVRFANGATGSVEASWIATGRKMQHDFEIYGSKGALVFSQERFNELGVYFADDKTGTRGFRTVFAGPDHEPYGAFCVAPGHQIGFNDLKAIEVRDFLRAVAGEASPGPGFAEGYEIQRLVELAYRSARERRWLTVD